MIKTSVYKFNPVKLIEEVKKRPGLYSLELPADREEKLQLWKEIGAALYVDWANFNKATAYDRILTLQRKWRSLRDAYNRELRLRRSGSRHNRRVYIYFKRLSFLGGFEGEILSDEDPEGGEDMLLIETQADDPLEKKETKPKKVRKKRRKKSSSQSSENNQPEDIEMAVYPEVNDDGDSDKLFLMSFLPEIKRLPLNIRMWARTQIANVMQEAVSYHYNNTAPGADTITIDIKRQKDTSD